MKAAHHDRENCLNHEPERRERAGERDRKTDMPSKACPLCREQFARERGREPG
jgi:hypothetical protein